MELGNPGRHASYFTSSTQVHDLLSVDKGKSVKQDVLITFLNKFWTWFW